MKMKSEAVAIALGVSLWLTLPGRAQPQGKELLNYAITGWASSKRPGPHWGTAITKLQVQQLFLDLASEPRDRTYLEKALAGTGVSISDLEALSLIRRDSNHYVLNFTFFTAADVQRIREVSEVQARSLAQAFLARRGEIEAALQEYSAAGVNPRAVAFILLGCFSLDWDGLQLSAQRGYRVTDQEHPDGNYIPWAEEKSDFSLQAIYWGSWGSSPYGDVLLASFGDHFSPRYTMPDLLSGLPRRAVQGNLPEPLKPRITAVVQWSVERTTKQVGRIMLALREGPKTVEELALATQMHREEAEPLVELLVELDYIGVEAGRYRADVPVLAEKDAAMVKSLRRIGWTIMDAWLTANYERVKNELAGITPMRYGVPYQLAFTQIWHYIFGFTNRELSTAGLFAAPYAPTRKYKGFIPFVYHASLRPYP